MSEIGKHVIELQEQNNVESLDEMEVKELTANDIPEAEWREWDLSKYTTEELEAEIDRRMVESSPYKNALESVYFPETFAMLDKLTLDLKKSLEDKPF